MLPNVILELQYGFQTTHGMADMGFTAQQG